MKRSWFVAASAAALLSVGTIGVFVPAASAAPPTSSWSGAAGGDVADVTTTAATLNVAGLGVAVSNATTDSQVTPHATSSSSNIDATAVGLPIAVSTNSVSAPPDAGPTTGGINASVTGLIDVGAITTTNEAHWSLPAACNTTGVLSAATTQTAGLSVLPALGGGMLSLGVSQSAGSTSLALNPGPNTGLNYGVKSVATGSLTGLSMLGGAVTVNVQGTTTLTATASGTSTGAVAYQPAVVTVTANGSTTTLNVGDPATVINIPLVGSVTLQMKAPVTTADVTSAQASVSLLSVSVALLGGVASTNVDVLPLHASATAPAGGIDCPPPAPVIDSPTSGQVTNNTTPAITGTAVPGATVNVSLDGDAQTGTATADASGNWTFTPSTALGEGSHTVSATQTVAGQTGPATADVPFTVDTTPPAPPVVLTPANGSVTNDATPAITGTAEAGSTVTVSIDGTPLATTTTADASGNWTLTSPTLTTGSHTVNATAKDAAGNVSGVSNTNTFTIDTTPPAPPVVLTPANGSSTNDTTPDITGTAEAGATVAVSIDGTPLATTTTADASGNWTLTSPTLTPGSHTVNATATDAAGNTSGVSNTNTFTIDTTPPAPPVVLTPANGSSTNDTTPAITGTAEAGSTVMVSIDGAPPLATAAITDASDNWSLTAPTLTPGSHTVNATATDAAGNTSAVSNTNTFTIDTTPPAPPVVLTPANGSVTNDTTPAITGTAEAGSTVTVSIDSSPLATTTTADASGNWTLTSPTLTPGSHTVNATAEDVAGNVSGVSNTNTFTIDTTPPAPPVVLTPANGSSTNDTTPDIAGTAEAGATVTVSIDSTPLAGTVVADASGHWRLTALALASGAHTVNATARDAAGNTSAASNTNTFTIDVTAPAAPVITSPANGSTTDDTTPAITGTAEAGSTVTVMINGTEAGTTTADSQGNWTFTPAGPLPAGSTTVTATATDSAGNVSPASEAVTFTITAPVVAPSSSGSSGSGGSTGGSSAVTSGTLPITGGDDMVVGWLIGSLLIGLGTLAVLMARRRRIS